MTWKKAILVAGASSGIGAAIVSRLAKDGDRLFGTQRSGAIKTPFYAEPQAPAMAEYSPWRDRFFKTMKGFEERAPGPEVVAEVFSRIVRSESPTLRNTVTREAKLFPFLRWILPAPAFEVGVRSGFKLDKPSG
jgi:hypothetical protein